MEFKSNDKKKTSFQFGTKTDKRAIFYFNRLFLADMIVTHVKNHVVDIRIQELGVAHVFALLSCVFQSKSYHKLMFATTKSEKSFCKM